jgi:hypothetical protein
MGFLLLRMLLAGVVVMVLLYALYRIGERMSNNSARGKYAHLANPNRYPRRFGPGTLPQPPGQANPSKQPDSGKQPVKRNTKAPGPQRAAAGPKRAKRAEDLLYGRRD